MTLQHEIRKLLMSLAQIVLVDPRILQYVLQGEILLDVSLFEVFLYEILESQNLNVHFCEHEATALEDLLAVAEEFLWELAG